MQTYLYVMVINNKRQGHLFQNMEDSSCVDLLVKCRLVDPYQLVDLQSSISYGQIDGVLESSLRFIIDYNLLCMSLCFKKN